jgi:hypothetical protein
MNHQIQEKPQGRLPFENRYKFETKTLLPLAPSHSVNARRKGNAIRRR